MSALDRRHAESRRPRSVRIRACVAFGDIGASGSRVVARHEFNDPREEVAGKPHPTDAGCLGRGTGDPQAHLGFFNVSRVPQPRPTRAGRDGSPLCAAYGRPIVCWCQIAGSEPGRPRAQSGRIHQVTCRPPHGRRARAPEARALVVAEVLCIRPDAVARHVEAVGHRLAPLGCHRGLAPIVGYAHGLPVFQLADGHVPV